MAGLPDISIVGAGKVGTAVGVLAARAGLKVVAVASRSGLHASAAAELIGGNVRVCTSAEAAASGGLVLLTVSDEAIEGLCDALAGEGAFAEGTIVAHCCGALGSDVLRSARQHCRCEIGSMHPLQTFPTVAAAVRGFEGTYCFCEGDGAAVAALEQLAAAIGGRGVRIQSAGKALYHAAAAMACNYMAALADAGLTLCEQAGVDRPTALAALAPLMHNTVRNIASAGPAGALTGPIARGETETVRRHVEALRACPEELRQLYIAAGQWTVTLARRKGAIDDAKADALRRILNLQ